ncbi:hypothetical protein SprV_0602044700 [Sparganum proliferum]
MIRVLLQDCHARLRKYRQRIDQEKTRCCEFMGEVGTNLLLQRIAEQAERMKTLRSTGEEFEAAQSNVAEKRQTGAQPVVKGADEGSDAGFTALEASFNTTDAKPVNMIAAVESILSQAEATEETKSLIRHQVSSLLMAHRPRKSSKVERDALRELKADKDLVIVPADKGRSTVVLDRTDYLQKAKGLLEDRQFYVPCDLAIETIELLLQSKYDETENRLRRAQVLQLLKFVRMYFTFDGTIYEQVKGTPMGSPISGLIAEAVLQRSGPGMWISTFVVIDRDQLLTFKERLNAVFPDIQFTMEEEENNQLAFLDVLVCRKDCGGLKTKVFRKATNTMQVLNFKSSNHPISHKRSCVRTLYRCVETHCSEPEDKIAELKYLRRVFKAESYNLRNFVNRCIRKRDERPNRTDTKVWRALPYVKNVSEAVGRLLDHLGLELHTDRRQPSGVS